MDGALGNQTLSAGTRNYTPHRFATPSKARRANLKIRFTDSLLSVVVDDVVVDLLFLANGRNTDVEIFKYFSLILCYTDLN